MANAKASSSKRLPLPNRASIPALTRMLVDAPLPVSTPFPVPTSTSPGIDNQSPTLTPPIGQSLAGGDAPANDTGLTSSEVPDVLIDRWNLRRYPLRRSEGLTIHRLLTARLLTLRHFSWLFRLEKWGLSPLPLPLLRHCPQYHIRSCITYLWVRCTLLFVSIVHPTIACHPDRPLRSPSPACTRRRW